MSRVRKNNAEYLRKWRKKNPGKQAAYCAKWYAGNKKKYLDWCRQKFYGLTPEEFEAKKAAQKGVCAICGRPPGQQELNVDHDHKTGKVRDLLCAACNRALGFLQDNPALLRKAAEYLERHLGEPI